MNRSTLILAAGLLAATAAFGQGMQTIKPVSAPVLQGVEVDQGAVARRKLEVENRRLQEENERLRQENAALNARIVDFTRLGGSEVHAYCADRNTSRNTAGASENCGPFACNEVSGLCKTRCATSNDCSSSTRCTVETGVCEVPPTDS